MTIKRCRKCTQLLLVSAFRKQNKKDGLSDWCRRCYAEWRKADRLKWRPRVSACE